MDSTDITIGDIFKMLERFRGTSISEKEFKNIHDNSKSQIGLSMMFYNVPVSDMKDLYAKVKAMDIINGETGCKFYDFKDIKVYHIEEKVNGMKRIVTYSFPFGYKDFRIDLIKEVY